MEWHGEQVIPEAMDSSSEVQRLTLKVHFERYRMARDWLAGRFQGRRIRLLDLACGTGFGSEILSDVGEVVGVDISEESVGYANSHYKNSNTSFKLGNADNKSFLEGLREFDAVVSLETIEHLADHYAYLKWVNKALRPGGALVVSFPSTFTMDWAVPHHKRDISRSAARRLFAECGFEIANRFNQGDRLPMRHMLSELRTNPDVPTPPLSQWVKYYFRHPDHMLRRIHQMTFGGGILLAHQQYLLEPIRAG
ncbi:MAG: class I SAM-dependent methyltransferase [candidate division WOR-3 bacterium]|nr:class I SAM-dependent methyltransferase [candidate division WOR-3 bacterium]